MARAINAPHQGTLGSSLSISIFAWCLDIQNNWITATVLFKKWATIFTQRFLLRWYISPKTKPNNALLKKR